MIINNKKQVLFLHVPKTGGSSIKELLLTQKSNDNKFEMWHSCHPKLFRLVEEIDFNKYFKFCVVRNPYDRFISIYKHQCFIPRIFKTQKNKKIKFNEIPLFLKEFTILKYNNIQINEGYNNEIDINLMTATPNYKLFCKYLEYFFTLSHKQKKTIIKKQSTFICLDKKIAMDHIIKFENLENDLKFIMEKFDFEGELPAKNISISSNEKYVIPDKYKDMLYEVFKDDFINFNYDK